MVLTVRDSTPRFGSTSLPPRRPHFPDRKYASKEQKERRRQFRMQMQKAKELQSDHKLSLPESETEEKLSELSKATTSTHKSSISMHKESLHKALKEKTKKKKKKKKLVMKSKASP